MHTALALTTMLLAYPAPRDRDMPDKGPGYLGITFETGGEGGVMITEVRPDGPAMQAGLKASDVIRKFNGDPISFDAFAKKIIRIRPGTVVPLDIMRDGNNMVIKVRIGIRPDDFPFPLPDSDDPPMPPPLLPEPPVPPPE
jgi:predicted metalloprotease with PDZ domain